MKKLWIGIVMVGLLSVCSCGGGSKMNAQWEEIDGLCDSIPEEAIGLLDSIKQEGLSEKDLNRWRLLWIKSRDKAYVAHTSDTLILDVVDYYDRHRSEGLYPEALYYGGRVYSDLGDLPTALEFFQKSLDEIPEDDAHLRFKGTVLDQTGRLLHTLRLDSAAIEYLEKSLDINSKLHKKDPNDAFTHGLIAGSLRRMRKFNEARKHMDEAVKVSAVIKEDDQTTIKCELAEFLLHEGNIDSALSVIRPLPFIVDSITTPFCLAVAATIYKQSGILDTAYMYARQLTRLCTYNNKKTGYQVIFSDDMKPYVPKDTLLKLMPEYKKVVEEYLNTHNAEQALIQNARYNYSTHIRERDSAERKLKSVQATLWFTGGVLTILILVILSAFLWKKYGKAKKDSSLMRGILLTEKVKERVRQSKKADRDENDENILAIDVANPAQAKERILSELKSVMESNPTYLLNQEIRTSQIYRILREKAESKLEIGKNISWSQIEELVKSGSPYFDVYLDILTANKISLAEHKVAYLMKLGFSNTQIADLLDRLPGTVSNQRSSIARKIGCEKSVVDAMVMRL